MGLADDIYRELELLPEDKQVKVLDFIKHLREKEADEEIKEWNDFSLSSALEGIEEDDEVEYTLEDIKERYTND